MDRVLAASLAIAALGLLLLAALAHALEPAETTVARLGRFEGQRVCLEADVVSLRPLPGGSTRFVLADATASVPGSVPFPITAVAGDRVHACATVRRGHAGLEFAPSSADDVRVTRAWDADAASLPALASAPWTSLDRHVLLRGVAIDEGARTYLEDPATRARVRLADEGNVPRDVRVTVAGTVTYDADTGTFRLHVEEVRGAGP